MTQARQRQVLAGVLVVLAVVIGWRVLSPGAGGGAGGVAGARGVGMRDGLTALGVVPLRLANLDLEEAEFHVGRDPFRFEAPRPQEAPPPPPQPQPRPPAANTRPVSQTPTQRADARPQPPPVDVVYLGRFGTTSRPIAVFSDGNEIFNVLEGGVIKGQFMVDKIGFESADLKFVGFPDAPSQRLAVGG